MQALKPWASIAVVGGFSSVIQIDSFLFIYFSFFTERT
jgi:hypothetical protein